jgi:hypothetical protein
MFMILLSTLLCVDACNDFNFRFINHAKCDDVLEEKDGGHIDLSCIVQCKNDAQMFGFDCEIKLEE